MSEAARHRAVQKLLGYDFNDVALLEQALTHSSTSDCGGGHNERLEFLGDAVLGLVVCELLYVRFPDHREGEMTKIKSHVVSRETCAALAQSVGIDKHLILGKGMQGSRSLPSSLSACAFESVIGAIFLDGGFEAARQFVRPLVERVVDATAKSGHQQNFKSVLQQHLQQMGRPAPIYRVLDEQGPDHAKCFKVCVEVGGKRYEPCWGATKKKAEQDAALIALRELGLVTDDGGELRIAGTATQAPK